MTGAAQAGCIRCSAMGTTYHPHCHPQAVRRPSCPRPHGGSASSVLSVSTHRRRKNPFCQHDL